MSRESEKALKAMHQFLDENGAEDMSMDEVNGLLQKFTEDCHFLAYHLISR